MITNACNLNCCYCFANEFVGGKSHSHISVENFRAAVDFISTANKKETLGLIGGEPTLHPRFQELLKISDSCEDVGEVILFTNGVYLNDWLEEISKSKISILVNVNSPEMIGVGNFQSVCGSIVNAIDNQNMSDRVSVGVNVYSSKVDYDYIFSLLNLTSLDSLRISMAIPKSISRDESPLLSLERRKKVVVRLIDKCLDSGVMPYYDCNEPPLCLVTRNERERIIRKCGERQVSNIYSAASNCVPVIDILQDLVAVRCFGLSDDLKVDIRGFETLDDLRQFFVNNVDVYSHISYHSPECANCYERHCKKCSGGCLAYKKEQIANMRQELPQKGAS